MIKHIFNTSLAFSLVFFIAIPSCAKAADSSCRIDHLLVNSVLAAIVIIPVTKSAEWFKIADKRDNFKPTAKELSKAHAKAMAPQLKQICNATGTPQVLASLVTDYAGTNAHFKPNDFARYRRYTCLSITYATITCLALAWPTYEFSKNC